MPGHPRFKELTGEELRIHDAKNTDYARGGDPLGNFRRVAGILGQYPGLDLAQPAVVALVYLMKQLDAVLWMMCRGYDGEVENKGTRLGDVGIYAKLARILDEEGDRVPGCMP